MGNRYCLPADGGLRHDLDALLGFFRRAGFMPPDKERLLAPLIDDVRGSFRRLSAPGSRLLRTAVMCEGPELVGHVSCIRTHRATWMFQHLAAIPGRRAGLALSRQIARDLLGVESCHYFKMWFHSHNPFPVRAFGGFARTIDNPDLSDLRAYGHITLQCGGAGLRPPAGIEVLEADDAGLAVVERFFLEENLLFQADDLSRERLRLAEVDRAYRREGLFRRRHVLLAKRDDEVLGFALAEVSSPGLNLSEGLSSFRLHILGAGRTASLDVRAALLESLRQLYRDAGRAAALGLLPTSDLPEYERLGLRVETESLCWTAHRSLLPAFVDHLDRLATSHGLSPRLRQASSATAAALLPPARSGP